MKLLRDYSLVLLAFQVALRSLLLAQDGLPDSTFHFDGKVTTEISMAYCFSVAVQSDGKVVAAGYSNTANLDFTLIRYNTDGSLDNSFDSDGVTTTAIGTDDDIARALAIQSDGKILAAGEGRSSGNYFFAVVRYNADGTLDTTFGTGGKVTNDSGNTAEAVLVQTDGKILVAGYTDNSDFAVARYNSDGSLDTTFGINGLAVADIGNADIALSSVIQSDGKIVMAGYTRYASRDDFALVRFDSNGSLDNTFGSDGIVTT
ncbi:MAG: calcium-binding protein, partial [Ignavibacteriales bacterium]|nr:calcium-binding protein [Ignavibacteriales bacterium]